MPVTCRPSYPRSFRLTCDMEEIPLVESLLAAEGYRFEPEPFSPFCRKLLAEPEPLGASLAAFFGYIYIQDRSSMLPPLALAPARGSAILDMCASPGSKTGFLAQLAGEEGFVLANEPNAARLATLRANMHRLNFLQVGTCSHAGEKLPLAPASLPMILLDPPCSGWGTAERHPRAQKMWQGDKIDSLVSLQRRLLRHAASLLGPGGRLIYSTCTTNRRENEDQTLYAQEVLGLETLPLSPFPGFVFEERKGGEGSLLVCGEESSAQGFYLSLLRKPGTAPPMPGPKPEPGAPQWGDCLFDAGRLPPGEMKIFGGRMRFVPAAAMNMIAPGLRWQGALLGLARDGGQFCPAPRLRRILPRDKGPRIALEKVADIRSILRGTAVQSGLGGNAAALWWRDLPLGRVALKNGRIVARFQ